MLYIKKNLITVMILFFVLLTGCTASDRVITFGLDEADDIAASPEDLNPVETYESGTESENDEESATEETIYLCVYVCGAVAESGVVYLPEGSRILDALELAGGFTEEADRVRINLAGLVYDGQQIYFPRVGEEDYPVTSQDEYAASGTEDAGNGLVNINTADVAALCTIPGIGEVKANAIIKYRTENGLFSDASEITTVQGIGEGVYENIKGYICTDSKKGRGDS